MKYKIFIITVLVLLAFAGCKKDSNVVDNDNSGTTQSPQGKVDKSQTIKSAILTRNVPFAVYMPPGYDTSKLTYPVLYLLHGAPGGSFLDFVNYGNIGSTLNNAINLKKAKPMIVIMPEGYNSFWCNNFEGGTMLYEDYMIQELFPYIESKYRVKTTRANRAIAGFSAGGWGAAYNAFKWQEMFGSCYSISAPYIPLQGSMIPDVREIINLKSDAELAVLPAFTMEVGTEDTEFYSSNVIFHNYLTDKGIQHTYIARTGDHNWSFAKECLPKVVEFVSKYFPD
jgi:enterochelin esterase-like enzyme